MPPQTKKTNHKDQEAIAFLQMYIIPVAAVVILILLTVFLFFPKYNSITETLSKVSTVDSNTEILNQNIGNLNKSKGLNTYLDSSISKYEVIMPTEPKVTEVVSRLEQIAKTSDYGPDFFVSAKAQEDLDTTLKNNSSLSSGNLPKGISSISLVLTVQGPLEKILKYTNQILNDSRLITIEKVKWTSSEGLNYSAQFNIITYFGEKVQSTAKVPSSVNEEKLLIPVSPITINVNKSDIDNQLSRVK